MHAGSTCTQLLSMVSSHLWRFCLCCVFLCSFTRKARSWWRWRLTCDVWFVTCDVSCVTCDGWRVLLSLKFAWHTLPSSLCLPTTGRGKQVKSPPLNSILNVCIEWRCAVGTSVPSTTSLISLRSSCSPLWWLCVWCFWLRKTPALLCCFDNLQSWFANKVGISHGVSVTLFACITRSILMR